MVKRNCESPRRARHAHNTKKSDNEGDGNDKKNFQELEENNKQILLRSSFSLDFDGFFLGSYNYSKILSDYNV